MRKIKEIIKHYKLYIILGIIMVLLLFLLIGKYRLSPLEEIAITKYSNEMMPYMNVLEKDDVDNYVCYTLVYYNDVYKQQEVSTQEISDFINRHFSKKVTTEQIQSLGITPYMIENHITYNTDNRKYVIHTNELSYSEIAKTKIVKYSIDKIKKQNNNTYQITYHQYMIKNPYEILNYYQDTKNDIAVQDVKSYLKGDGNRKQLEKYLDNKNISRFAKYVKTVKVQYKIDKNHILIFVKK